MELAAFKDEVLLIEGCFIDLINTKDGMGFS